MRKCIVLIRHGETEANLHRIVQGTSEAYELTRRGLEQMRAAAEFLKTFFSHAVVWSSPLARATGSARILVEKTGFAGPTLLEDLKQRDWGLATGKSYDEQVGEIAYLGEPGNELPKDTEPTNSIRNRLTRTIARIHQHPQHNHVIVGHNELLNYLLDTWRESAWKKRSFSSGEIVRLDFGREGRICKSYQTIFPPKIVYLKDVRSLLDVKEAVQFLESHSLKVTAQLTSDMHAHVVAVVLGDKPFGVKDAVLFPRLRTVARFGTGVDNVDVEGLWTTRRIPVSCTVGLATQDVAEFALALLIIVLRRAHMDAGALKATGSSWRSIGRGRSLYGSTIGIIGCGRIGSKTAKLAYQCGAKVLLWNRSWPPTQVPLHGLDPFERVRTLKELAKRCDAVSIHVALTKSTQGLIGRNFFNETKRNARSIVLVNTSRGKVVNEIALLRAVKTRIVHAAAIDVWSCEGSNTNKTVLALRAHPVVFSCSHIAAYTIGVRDRFALQCARNVVALVEGRRSEVKEFIVKVKDS